MPQVNHDYFLYFLFVILQIPTDFILEVSEKNSVHVGRKLLNVEQLHWKAKAKV